MTPAEFIAKWSPTELSERAASHEHFIDLCRMLGQPTPAEFDSSGAEYTFERGVTVTGPASARSKGESGFADVWWRKKFGWEYKRKDKHKTLKDAYDQLLKYREALENPPLLIVSDISRIEIHTNFTGTKKEIIEIALAEIGHPDKLSILRRVFTDPDSFKPPLTTWKLTESAAAEFAKIADGLRQRKVDPHDAAHFLMKCMFCLFAEDVKLLPDKLFSKVLERGKIEPEKLPERLTNLFRAMSTGGDYGADTISWFNGGLFDDSPALKLNTTEIVTMLVAAQFDWAAVEPSIFGTLFERSLDPDKRAQIGAHYTSRDDIMLIVEPVVMAPLRREWQAVQDAIPALLQKRREATTKQAKNKADGAIAERIEGFLHRLATVRILDPACGSGNFLYVAIQQLLDLEKEVIVFASRPEIGLGLFPRVRPTQLHGIEINPYAAELAQVVIWIGYVQWMRENGFALPKDPILTPLQTIENRDAILDFTIPTKPQPAKWPEADFIIGNPPFLGGNFVRKELGDDYVESMFTAYDLPNFSDLCCYWFEQARVKILARRVVRAGLLATQGIRGGANREVLRRILDSGGIFMAWSDREWILDGANVHVSLVGFDNGAQLDRMLNGVTVPHIHANLAVGADTTTALDLTENHEIQHEADKKGAPFDLSWERARAILAFPGVGGDIELVCRPWANGQDTTRRTRAMWVIDFGASMPLEVAAKHEAAFEYVVRHVAPKYKNSRKRWWIHERPRPAMRRALAPLARFVATAMLTKHRIFVWLNHDVLPDHQLVVFARGDDYFFGSLHCSIHELWARKTGTQLREAESGFRYTPTTCFETFPLPWPPGKEPTDHPAYIRISDAARELNEQRERWLNPPEWIDEIAAVIDRRDDFADVPDVVVPPATMSPRALIRQSAIMAAAAKDPRLKKRTLTNLYNERPTWLRLAHEKLDRAVLAAYAAVDPEGEWSEDWAEVWVESGAGQPLAEGEDRTPHPLAERRRETDQRVLGNLLRMNLARAGR